MKGLVNLGNTCYFNSAIQCLLQVPCVTNFLILKSYEGDCKFTKEFINIARKLWIDKEVRDVDPSALHTIFTNTYETFGVEDIHGEHDAHDALISILEILEASIPTCIKPAFNSKAVTEIVTPKGKTSTTVTSPVLMVSPPGDSVSDMISNEEQWLNVTDHKEFHILLKRTFITDELPKALIVTTASGIPNPDQQLTLHGRNFDLISGCIYQGTGNTGHYVAVCKHKNTWYLKDDSNVTKIDTIPVNNCYYYVMIYKQLRDPASPTIPEA